MGRVREPVVISLLTLIGIYLADVVYQLWR